MERRLKGSCDQSVTVWWGGVYELRWVCVNCLTGESSGAALHPAPESAAFETVLAASVPAGD